ncbi:cytosolic carboxypeptidase 2-like isoform x2 [Plakobranchus ocellatus]|uniref:Cytosolic carboxypeptidase 2-like isoform x2 n=1 Tax=Plakobranchus ocellatus TaxID=259542 RepID=A0AAV4CA86_9GAST|nr:cytosolic carboxypeptidase 2-like isoform x2 [Plakobranchus ocellatus]
MFKHLLCTGGSDSDVSDGPPVHLQYAAARPKKKKLKSKRDRDRARKDELKKLSAPPEDKRLRNTQVKPLKQDMGKMVQGQPIRYTSNSPKRPRSIDDRSNTGIPVFVQERFEEKQQKRHDYLEALTAAYISNNIPIVNDPGQQQQQTRSARHSCGRERCGSACPSRPKTAALATAGLWAPAEVSLSRNAGDINRDFQGPSDLATCGSTPPTTAAVAPVGRKERGVKLSSNPASAILCLSIVPTDWAERALKGGSTVMNTGCFLAFSNVLACASYVIF